MRLPRFPNEERIALNGCQLEYEGLMQGLVTPDLACQHIQEARRRWPPETDDVPRDPSSLCGLTHPCCVFTQLRNDSAEITGFSHFAAFFAFDD